MVPLVSMKLAKDLVMDASRDLPEESRITRTKLYLSSCLLNKNNFTNIIKGVILSCCDCERVGRYAIKMWHKSLT